MLDRGLLTAGAQRLIALILFVPFVCSEVFWLGRSALRATTEGNRRFGNRPQMIRWRLHSSLLPCTCRTAVLVAVVVSLALPAYSQDMRHVTEPVFPPVCERVVAKLSSVQGRTLAAADEAKLDTARVQEAIDRCAPGHAVELDARGTHDAFLSGPLDLRRGVTLLVGKGAILFGSRNPRDYDLTPGSCGVLSHAGHGCKALINGDDAPDAGVMGDGTIDGRGGSTMLGQKVSWWQLAREAQVKKSNQNCPRLIALSHCDHFTLYRITLKNSPNFHVFYRDGNGFTAWGVIIKTPRNARNTDGIDPSSSTNVTITHCYISDGDDDVAIKAGSDGPASHISIVRNHFYHGHGVSIGSETNGGVSDVIVHRLTIDGADNGIRIKSNISRGGLVQDVIYKDVCIRATRNPILMDSNYSFYGAARNLFPEFTGILLEDVRIEGAGRITLDGYGRAHRLGMTFEDVTLSAPGSVEVLARHARIALGPGVNFLPSGDDVSVSRVPANGHADTSYSCQFPPFPSSH